MRTWTGAGCTVSHPLTVGSRGDNLDKMGPQIGGGDRVLVDVHGACPATPQPTRTRNT